MIFHPTFIYVLLDGPQIAATAVEPELREARPCLLRDAKSGREILSPSRGRIVDHLMQGRCSVDGDSRLAMIGRFLSNSCPATPLKRKWQLNL